VNSEKKEFGRGLPKLPDAVLWRLQRCDGYLDLKMRDKARSELERIHAPYDHCDLFLEAELRLAMEDSRWCDATKIAHTLKERRPTEPMFCVQLAYATRRAESLESARDILIEALKRFPKIAVIPFNLACYECQLGRHEKAMDYLAKAFQLDAAFHDQALEDEDLKPLWDKLEC
jgi:Flp pilus assembly protein TadD